jgi:hypothetical protein
LGYKISYDRQKCYTVSQGCKVYLDICAGFPEGIKIVPFYDVVYNGTKLSKNKEVDPPPNGPDKNDIAIIMFTSGSTGVSGN